jgi:hypothetical protein
MFLSHLPENPKAKERYAKIQAQLDGYASAGTQVELCFPDDYPGAKLSSNLGARNEVPGIYHMLQTPAIIRKIVWAENNGYDAVVQSNTFDPGWKRLVRRCASPSLAYFARRFTQPRFSPTRSRSLRPLKSTSLTHGKLFTPTACRALSKILRQSASTTKTLKSE